MDPWSGSKANRWIPGPASGQARCPSPSTCISTQYGHHRSWVAADVEARGLEILAVNVNPRIPRGVLGLAEDVGTVVNAVEVDRLSVVAFPFAVRWRGEADHRGQRRPAINVRHHLVVLRARRNMIRPPHNARNAPTSLEGRTFFAAERVRATVGIRILPRAVVGSRNDDGVWRLRANDIHNPADVIIEFQHRI